MDRDGGSRLLFCSWQCDKVAHEGKGRGEEGCEAWARSLSQLVAPLIPRSWVCFFDVVLGYHCCSYESKRKLG